MKKQLVSIVMAVIMLLCLAACSNADKPADLWDSATYQKDTTLGSGATTVQVEVQAEEKSVTFTIKTDETILGDALMEHNLIAGEESEYGLYIKVVNGITADYDVDQTYWGFFKDGEYMMTGVDSTEIEDGAHYELVRTK